MAEYFLGEFCARNNFMPSAWPEARSKPSTIRLAGKRARTAQHRRAHGDTDRGHEIASDSVPVEIRIARGAAAMGTSQARESAEREHILKALDESSWNVSGAARVLGMERTNLHKRIRALGLSREK